MKTALTRKVSAVFFFLLRIRSKAFTGNLSGLATAQPFQFE
jgi:hypothetical protein